MFNFHGWPKLALVDRDKKPPTGASLKLKENRNSQRMQNWTIWLGKHRLRWPTAMQAEDRAHVTGAGHATELWIILAKKYDVYCEDYYFII